MSGVVYTLQQVDCLEVIFCYLSEEVAFGYEGDGNPLPHINIKGCLGAWPTDVGGITIECFVYATFHGYSPL